jgi:cell division protein FtsW
MRKALTALITSVVLLLGFGVVLVASASTVRAAQQHAGDPHFFFKRQLMWLAIAALLGLAATRFDYHWWKQVRACWILLLAGLILMLVAVRIPGIGRLSHGSWRWINLGPVSFQPSELAKLGVVVLTSVWMAALGPRVRQFWRGFVVPISGLVGCMALLFLEPDFGAIIVVAVLGCGILFVAGTRLIYLVFGGLGGVITLAALLVHDPVRRERIRVYIERVFSPEQAEWLLGPPPPDAFAAGTGVARAGHQLHESLQAFISGGPFGVGLNNSIQKHFYLPEAHTDCIFAIAGEELGLIATLGVVILFAIILASGMYIALRAPDKLGRLMAFGMTLLLVFQAAFNIGVVTGCLPTKGIALPFISYGGTNLVTALMAVGVLVNIGRHADQAGEDLHTQTIRDAVREV